MSLGATVGRIRDDLSEKGWSYLPRWHTEADGGAKLIELAACFGTLVSHGDEDGVPEVLTATRCDDNAPIWEPFNRPEAIGWHNDYSTHPERPDLSFVWVMTIPPPGEPRGDWLVASCEDVVAKLRESAKGRAAIDLLSSRDLLFCSPDGEDLHSYRVLTEDHGTTRVRYYDRAIRHGLVGRGDEDEDAVVALAAWTDAADFVARRCEAHAGALLACDNWRSIHGRTAQANGRCASLCAVHSWERATTTRDNPLRSIIENRHDPRQRSMPNTLRQAKTIRAREEPP